MDRISQLPEPILHHILCFLSTKEAFQTCVLSKSWLHLGPTRPKFDFRESYFTGKKKPSVPEPDGTASSKWNSDDFIPVMEKTLQRYHDQNLCIHEFSLGVCRYESKHHPASKSFLEKWIPIVFESKSIRKIRMEKFRMKLTGVSFPSKHLETLSLKEVEVVDKDEGEEEESEKPVLRRGVVNSNNNLKSMYLDDVQLSSESFECLSLSFPSLETLHLLRCFGFEEMRLSSSSIRHLRMEGTVDGPAKKSVFDVPSLVRFEYEGDLPNNIHFKTPAYNCKSKIVVRSFVEFDYDAASWCLKMNGFLQALSESEISLDIVQDLRWDHNDNGWFVFKNGVEVEIEEEEDEEEDMESDDDMVGDEEEGVESDGFFYGPVEVEHLHLSLVGHSEASTLDLMINLLGVCHPRNMYQFWHFDPQSGYQKQENQIIKFMSKALVLEGEISEYSWQRDLEEVIMEQVCDDEDGEEVCIRLKWKHFN